MFPRDRVDDVAGRVHQELARLSLGQAIRAGQSVAITAGSRGIANIAEILRATVDHVRSLGAEPFLVPAMGSHGGGTAQGQVAMLAKLGITEASCGCPIRASMDTIEVGQTTGGVPIHIDRIASQADHVIVANRIKPHTIFSGQFQSGLMKMLLIGLGKHEGAKIYHEAAEDRNFDRLVLQAAPQVIRPYRVAAGLAVIENAFDDTAHVEAVAPDDFLTREPELLKMAVDLFPRLPFSQVDVLLVDQMGKNISGAGMDTNVLGRKGALAETSGIPMPSIRHVAVRSLTRDSLGNALGIGLADGCRQSLIDAIDMEVTLTNGRTSREPEKSVIPPGFATDRSMLDAAFASIEPTPPETSRLLWVRDTMHLAELECAPAFLEEAKSRDDLEVLGPPRPLPFDTVGNLPPDGVAAQSVR